ncbi:MAG: septal ring lytic transglycosylase RlpA family protein [Melioribacteraceae bacterium]|nr:MAG: septal ring lytic transglycosylase RlpA family protein [Melioribacteraceae bacterium]
MIKSLSFLLVLLLAACSSTVRYQKVRYETDREEKEKVVSVDITESEAEVTDDEVLETQTGVASFYADKYDGRPTYSGEIYNMNGLSAAHPSYRMGTIVRVTNLYNNKTVTIPINDRMPFRPDRIIDLSYGVAVALDMVIAGIVDVKVEVLKWGEGRK